MKLVICEKWKSATRIAGILSDGKAKKIRRAGIPLYTFSRDGEEWFVLGLKGHIVSIDFPEELREWESVPLEKLVWTQPIRIVSDEKIDKAIRSFSDCHDLDIIVATDFDREGELIGLEAVELLKRYNKGIRSVKRARFSTLTRDEIKRAFLNLTDIDLNLARSAEARQVIDLVWGATLTRFISLSAERKGKDYLSIGRVQSPTLSLIVEREREIRSFTPKPYWQIVALLRKGTMFSALHHEGNFFEEKVAREIYDRIKDEKIASVKSYEEIKRKEPPPHPFDTTSFLHAASNILGISAPRAMDIAEDLYMSGWISYPRTDNTVYPKDIPLLKVLEGLSRLYPREVGIVKSKLRKVPSRGKKVSTDHPPIYPVGTPPLEELDDRHRKVYDLIARRFMATLMKDSVVEIRRCRLIIGGETFLAEGKVDVEKGWKEIYPLRDRERAIPKMKEGEEVDVLGIKLLKKLTTPPKRYTQGSLIIEMEKLGLGTKSTRHEIIRKLYERRYVTGSRLIPTESAFAVVDVIRPYDISKPEMTAHLEKEMDRIAEGGKSKEEVIEESRKLLEKVLRSLREDEESIRKALRSAIREQSRVGRCPVCGKDLVIRFSSSGKRFIGCTGYPKCKVTYPLPQKGFLEKTGKTCRCGAPILRIGGKERCVNPDCGR